MQTPQHGHSQQQSQQQQQLPLPDIPPLTMSASLPNLNPRDHEQATYHLDHNAVFGSTLTDPTTHTYVESVHRPSSSHDVLPSFPHHPHAM